MTTTDEIIKKLGIEPISWAWQHEETGNTGFVSDEDINNGFFKNNPRLFPIYPNYTNSDLDRIVTELTKEIDRLNIENQAMFDSEGKNFAALKEAYEAQIGVLRDLLQKQENLWEESGWGFNINLRPEIQKALAQSSPQSALDDAMNKAHEDALEHAADFCDTQYERNKPLTDFDGRDNYIEGYKDGAKDCGIELRNMAAELKG